MHQAQLILGLLTLHLLVIQKLPLQQQVLGNNKGLK
jgi:hypothetical protein